MKYTLREILYKSHKSLKNRLQAVSIVQKSETDDDYTRIRKVFIYQVNRVKCITSPLREPTVHITKTYDTNTFRETSSFRIKGVFYLLGDQLPLKVNFCHSLLIETIPKDILSRYSF